MALEHSCPGCDRARRIRPLRWLTAAVVVVSILGGIAALGVVALTSLDPFAFETSTDPARDWHRILLLASLPWVSAIACSAAFVALGRRLLRPTPAPSTEMLLYRSSVPDPRCALHR